MTLGCTSFVIGICIAGYCGYLERYAGDPQADWLKLSGWGLLFLGIMLFLFGILQSSVRR